MTSTARGCVCHPGVVGSGTAGVVWHGYSRQETAEDLRLAFRRQLSTCKRWSFVQRRDPAAIGSTQRNKAAVLLSRRHFFYILLHSRTQVIIGQQRAALLQ
ncbi:MAG: hypothetical protein H6643_13230 [Caldilineaceae bacterium]|nr:hypothetical protein [Caldilineaceae bacterium]